VLRPQPAGRSAIYYAWSAADDEVMILFNRYNLDRQFGTDVLVSTKKDSGWDRKLQRNSSFHGKLGMLELRLQTSHQGPAAIGVLPALIFRKQYRCRILWVLPLVAQGFLMALPACRQL
jgi:hypothetical protein